MNNRFIKLKNSCLNFIKRILPFFLGVLLPLQVCADPPLPKPEGSVGKIYEQCVEILRKALDHENSFVRSAAIRAIGESGDSRLLDLLIKGSKDIYPTARQFALQAVVKLAPDQALKLAQTLLKDYDIWVRVEALKVIGNKGGTDWLPKLVPYLKDPDQPLRVAAAGALFRLGVESYLNLIVETAHSKATTYRYHAIRELGQLDSPKVIPVLVDLLSDPDEDAVFYTLQSLGEVINPQLFPSLLALLEHNNPSVRYQAVIALGFIEDHQKVISEIEKHCDDEDGLVRLSAAVSLIRSGSRACEKNFLSSLKHNDFGVRSAAARVLGSLEVSEKESLLAMALQDPHSRVRTAAVRSVGKIGGPTGFALLFKMLGDSLEAIRAYAAGNLIKLMIH